MLLQPMMSLLCLVVVTEGINLIDLKNQLTADIKELEKGTILKTVTTFDMQMDNVQFATSLTSWWNTIDCDSNKLNITACNIRGMTEYYGKLKKMMKIIDMNISKELSKKKTTEIRESLTGHLTLTKSQNKCSKGQNCNKILELPCWTVPVNYVYSETSPYGYVITSMDIKPVYQYETLSYIATPVLGALEPCNWDSPLFACSNYLKSRKKIQSTVELRDEITHTLPIQVITVKKVGGVTKIIIGGEELKEENPTILIKQNERGINNLMKRLKVKLQEEDLMRVKEVRELITFIDGKLAELEKEKPKVNKNDQEETKVVRVDELLNINERKKDLIKVIAEKMMELKTVIKLKENEKTTQVNRIKRKIIDMLKIEEEELRKVKEFKKLMNANVTEWNTTEWNKLSNLIYNNKEVIDLLSSGNWTWKTVDDDVLLFFDKNYWSYYWDSHDAKEMIEKLKASNVMASIAMKEEQLNRVWEVVMSTHSSRTAMKEEIVPLFIWEEHKPWKVQELIALFIWEEGELMKVNELVKSLYSTKQELRELTDMKNAIKVLTGKMEQLRKFIKLENDDLLFVDEFKMMEEMINKKFWNVKEWNELEEMKKLREEMEMKELMKDGFVNMAMNFIIRTNKKWDVIEELKKIVIAIKDLTQPLKEKQRDLKQMVEEKKVMEQLNMTIEVERLIKLIEKTKYERDDLRRKLLTLKFCIQKKIKYFYFKNGVPQKKNKFRDEDPNRIFLNGVSQKKNMKMPLRSCDVGDDEWKCETSRIQDVCESESHKDSCYYIGEIDKIEIANID